jgi:hypothetical protein
MLKHFVYYNNTPTELILIKFAMKTLLDYVKGTEDNVLEQYNPWLGAR